MFCEPIVILVKETINKQQLPADCCISFPTQPEIYQELLG